MKDIIYGLIILNYNTADDCRIAVESIENTAMDNKYAICIVDGGSTKAGESEKLNKLIKENIHVLYLDKNVGYSKGNNAGIIYIQTMYRMKYIVIMNPDVEILQYGTIDSLISNISSKKNIIGAQPLINCNDIPFSANEQICIRRHMTYLDILISDSWILKKIFRKEFCKLTYSNEIPYKKFLEFDIPSGAFFIIDSKFFNQLGLFDDETFLYSEEVILGHKVWEKNKKFMLNPNYQVNHYQGKSTGSHVEIISKFSMKCTVESNSIYLRKYLKESKAKIHFYVFVYYFSQYTKRFIRRMIDIFN